MPQEGVDDGFNSTLVQLKEGLPCSPKSGWNSFNSTLVQLKVRKVSAPALDGTRFNSTLVQLKVLKDVWLTIA